jgi:amylosucrase
MIFSGDELATVNDYSWEGSPSHGEDNRWMHRPRLDWSRAEGIEAAKTPSGRIWRWIANCLSKRRTVPAFAQNGPFRILPSSSENLLFCLRQPSKAEGQPVLVVANFSPESRAVSIDLAALGLGDAPTNMLGNRRVVVAAGKLEFESYAIGWISPAPA